MFEVCRAFPSVPVYMVACCFSIGLCGRIKYKKSSFCFSKSLIRTDPTLLGLFESASIHSYDSFHSRHNSREHTKVTDIFARSNEPRTPVSINYE
jgi:hypothetical protein